MSKNLLLKKILHRSKKKTSVLDRLVLIIISAGFLLMLVFLIYLIWFTLTNRSVTHLLPAEKTVAYFELEDLSLPPRLDQEAVFNLLGLRATLDSAFGLDIDSLQSHLASGRLGLALVKSGGDENRLLMFFRLRNQKKALDFFESIAFEGENLGVEGEKPNQIYSYPQSHHFVFGFIGPYLFISQKSEPLKVIQAVYYGDELSLNSDENYQKSLANLPRQVWGRGYLNVQTLNFGDNYALNQLSNSLKHIINHFALTIRKQYNGLHFNTLLSINPELLALKKGYTDPTRFVYSLADYISSKNLALYIGGANLSDEWQSTLDTISQLNPAYGIILEGIIRAQVNKIFGENISLRNDLYPLFEGEYAVAVENLESGQLGLKLILKNTDRQFAEIKLEKMIDGFQLLAAQFAPKLKIFTLPDGTESRELISDPSRLEEESETYEGYSINCLDVRDSLYGFCYTVTDQLVVMSNNSNSIKETIDLSISPRFVLSQYQPFRQTLSNLSAVSDEITFIDLDKFAPLLKNEKVAVFANSLMENFEAVTWIKHYFNDGVSTEGYLLLK